MGLKVHRGVGGHARLSTGLPTIEKKRQKLCILSIAECCIDDTLGNAGEGQEERNMEFTWEEFAHPPVEANTKRIHASINKRGNLFLNRHAIAAISNPDRVTLMYDRRRLTIGIKSANPGSPYSFRLRSKDKERGSSRMIYAANFCRFYHICPDETLAFTDARVDANGILILSLNDVISVKRL